MACCCKCGSCNKATSCLGRCGLPKHRCLNREEIKPGPVPGYMGWHYTAKDAPEHQLRCGWRPGHISCPVLRKIEQHHCSMKIGECGSCRCSRPPCVKPCCLPAMCPPPRCPPPRCPPPRCPSPRCPPPRCPPPRCPPPRCPSPRCPSPRCPPPRCPPPRCPPPRCPPPRCPPPRCPPRCPPKCPPPWCIQPRCPPPGCPSASPCGNPPCDQPLIKVTRHGGQYIICTKPSDICTAPSGPYPLKYVLNTDCCDDEGAKFSVEAKFNDYRFDYTSSQASFVLEFSPPELGCNKPCGRPPCPQPC